MDAETKVLKDTMVDGPDTAEGAAFAQALSALKERGSNLLVVGGTLEGAQADVCDRLLGEDAERPRRRVFVRTDGTTGCIPGPGMGPGERTRVVTQSTSTRSISAAPVSSQDVPTQTVAEADLGELASATADAIDDVEPARGFDPAELRVCFDSLLPLFADHDRESVFRMLDLVSRRVAEVDGMGHYHLPVDADEEVVRLLEPLVDAVVELRVRDGDPEHNWDLVDRDVESGWLPL